MRIASSILGATALCAAALAGATAQAIPATTGRLDVSVTIARGCETAIGGDSGALALEFGIQTTLEDDIDQTTQGTSVITVNCGNGVTYTVSLDAGRHSDDIGKRLMRNLASHRQSPISCTRTQLGRRSGATRRMAAR